MEVEQRKRIVKSPDGVDHWWRGCIENRGRIRSLAGLFSIMFVVGLAVFLIGPYQGLFRDSVGLLAFLLWGWVFMLVGVIGLGVIGLFSFARKLAST